MGFSEQEVVAICDMFEGLGYQIIEVICDLEQIDHFVIELEPLNRSASWTAAMMQEPSYSHIWRDPSRIINPVVDHNAVVIKQTEDRLIRSFNKMDDEQKKEMIAGEIFTIYNSLRTSYWVMALLNEEHSEDNWTGFLMTTIGPFDGIKCREISCPSDYIPSGTKVFSIDDKAIVFYGFEMFNPAAPLLVNVSNSCMAIVSSVDCGIDETDICTDVDSYWICGSSLPSGSNIILHTTIPDGDSTEMALRFTDVHKWEFLVTDKYLLCKSTKDNGYRMLMIPMDYVIELEYEIDQM